MRCYKCKRDKVECLAQPIESCNLWLYYEGHPISFHYLNGEAWYIYCLPSELHYASFKANGERISGSVGYNCYTEEYPFKV